jgi:hypothetical protein
LLHISLSLSLSFFLSFFCPLSLLAHIDSVIDTPVIDVCKKNVKFRDRMIFLPHNGRIE